MLFRHKMTQPLAQKIGKLIAQKRKQQALTQACLAEQLGITVDAMSKMERGVIKPSVERLEELAVILQCQTADFLTQTSTSVSDQDQRIQKLLQKLSPKEREGVVQMVELVVAWHLNNTKSQ